jgi:predicted nucleotidyltransferase
MLGFPVMKSGTGIDDPVRRKFTAALDSVVADIKADRSILAVILCGSLSHDTVWAGSDIDLILVTVDDRKIEGGHKALYADGVNVHAFFLPRAEFRRIVEGSIHNSFMHSLLAKGTLQYTHDETIAGLCARLHDLGERDRDIQLLHAASSALSSIAKAHKWLVTRGDLHYTALWILYAATPLAQMEVIAAGRLVDREVIPEALRLNPAVFQVIYVDLLEARTSRQSVKRALDAVDAYVAERALRVFAPVFEYLRDAGEARPASDLEHHFRRHYDIHDVITACEYLSDRGLIGKASLPARLTKKSNSDVQELAFFPL